MSKPSEIVVLAEDRRHLRFVYRYLKEQGFSPHEIRLPAVPGGKGCGEQFVRKHYRSAVATYRARSSRARTALVVIIDADTEDINRRSRQLEAELLPLDPRSHRELIVHLIPKRSIETWILCLNGLKVNEEYDYSREAGIDEQIPNAARVFFKWSRDYQMLGDDRVPSLRAALAELERLKPTA